MAASVQQISPLEADPIHHSPSTQSLLDQVVEDGAGGAFLPDPLAGSGGPSASCGGTAAAAVPARVGSPLSCAVSADNPAVDSPLAVGPFSHKETVVVLDWDDTLFPSSFVDRKKLIHARGLDELPSELQRGFAELERATTRLITTAATYGTVLIITNAQTGWVELCVSKFFPSLMETLSKHVRVVSARSAFERFFPGDPLCWKAAAFAHELHQQQKAAGTALKNVLSFGDSMEERTAVKIAAGQLRSRAKSVKFLDAPSPRQLHQQLEVVANCLEWIWRHNGDLDVVLTLEQHGEEGSSILESPPQTPVGGAHPPAASLPLPAAAVTESALQQQLRAQGASIATPLAKATAPAPAEGASSADVDAEEVGESN